MKSHKVIFKILLAILILKITTVSHTAAIYAQEVVEDTYESPEDVELLANIIYNEAGSYYCSDNLQLYVGSVVLNRVKSDVFPNTLREVIFQPGQYTCIKNGRFVHTPDERAYRHARLLLKEGSFLPDYVLFQAQGTGGHPTYLKEQNMYFGVYYK